MISPATKKRNNCFQAKTCNCQKETHDYNAGSLLGECLPLVLLHAPCLPLVLLHARSLLRVPGWVGARRRMRERDEDEREEEPGWSHGIERIWRNYLSQIGSRQGVWGGGRLAGSSRGSVDVTGGSGSGGPSAPAGSADGRQRVAAIQPHRCEIGARPREPQKRREAGSLGVQGSQNGE
jgi:hypothetical protein